MTKRLLVSAAVIFSPLATAQSINNEDIYGSWKIKAMIGGGAASTLTQRDVDKLIGKRVTITREKFAFNGRTCANPSYERTTENTMQFFDSAWRADVRDIHLPDPVTVIETGCNTLFPIRKDHLMIAEENVFLEAVRISNKSAGKSGAK